jgi:hypothetical protein
MAARAENENPGQHWKLAGVLTRSNEKVPEPFSRRIQPDSSAGVNGPLLREAKQLGATIARMR